MHQPKFRRAPRRKPVSDSQAIWLRPLIWLVIALVAYFGVVTWLLPVLVRLSSGTKIAQNFHSPLDASTRALRADDAAAKPAAVTSVTTTGSVPARTGGGVEPWCEDPGEPPRPPIVEPREYFFAVDSSKVGGCVIQSPGMPPHPAAPPAIGARARPLWRQPLQLVDRHHAEDIMGGGHTVPHEGTAATRVRLLESPIRRELPHPCCCLYPQREAQGRH